MRDGAAVLRRGQVMEGSEMIREVQVEPPSRRTKLVTVQIRYGEP